MPDALVNARIFAGGAFREHGALLVEGGRIAALTGADDPRLAGARTRDLGGALLLPGFIDTQVNGGGGVLFNDFPTVEGIRRIGAAHRRCGTTGFLPTLISDDLSVVAAGIAAVRAAAAAGVPGVLGIHIEGPFLSKEKKGVHNAQVLRTPDSGVVGLLSSLKTGTTLVTLAPEVTTPALLSQLRQAGVILSAGHTNATYADMEQAFAHGVTGITHLFNAMSPLTSREPGVVGAALHSQACWCGIIADGRHVDPVCLKIALAARPRERFMLVTDAMPCVGTAERSFLLQGRRILVEGDWCVDEQGTLAGTALTMAKAVRNAQDLLGLSREDAIRMASEYPAAFLGLDGQLGRIAEGHRASFVVADEELNVLDTWIDGVPASGG